MIWIDVQLLAALFDGMASAGIILVGINGAIASAIWPAFKHI